MQHEVHRWLNPQGRAQDGSLLQLPPVLYGKANDSRYGRSGRALPEAPRSLALILVRRRHGVATHRPTRRLPGFTQRVLLRQTMMQRARVALHAISFALAHSEEAARNAVPHNIAYGGQALVEGILMRGPSTIGVALRAVNGEILVATESLPNSPIRQRAGRLPIARGAAILWETLSIGARWLMRSAEVAAGEEVSETNGSRVVTVGILIGTLAAVLVGFAIIPAITASLIAQAFGGLPLIVERAIDAVLQVTILVAYLALAGRSAEVGRTYCYHGAEHRAIHTLEHGEPLTRENLARWPTAHPRCGTEFLVVVIVVSLVIFSLIGHLSPVATIISRIIGIPVVAGVAYEILRGLGRYRDHAFARLVAAPGMAVQRITTQLPDDEMHDVAIAALTVTLTAEGRESPAGSAQIPVRPLASARPSVE